MRQEVHTLIFTSRNAKGPVPHFHVNVHQVQIDFDKGSKPGDKASYHRLLCCVFIVLVPIALFAFLSRRSLRTEIQGLFFSRAKSSPAMRREKGYGEENTSLYREVHLALLLWNTWGPLVASLALHRLYFRRSLVSSLSVTLLVCILRMQLDLAWCPELNHDGIYTKLFASYIRVCSFAENALKRLVFTHFQF